MKKFINKSIKYILITLIVNMLNYSYATITINSVVNWNIPSYLSDNVVIKSGGQLTITADQYFLTSHTITVKCGGKLIVNSATLGCGISNTLWGGIIVEGNNTLSQTLTNQGYVELNNAIIENASCAIKDGDIVSYTYTGGRIVRSTQGGGIIKAENTQFINNKKAVQIAQYNRSNNICYFRNCDFIINSNALFNYNGDLAINLSLGSTAQVFLCNINKVRFQGCTFYNYIDKGRSIAIVATQAGLLINTNDDIYGNSISTDPYFLSPCTFNGFAHAIHIESAGTKPITILHSSFVNNTAGIVNYLTNTLRIESNEFMNGLIGIYLSECSKFKIENNDFNNFSTFGIELHFKNITENNYIRYNSYRNCCNANYVGGVNSNGITSYSQATGLRFLCNTFNVNSIDIVLDKNSAIAYFQGTPNDAAGNEFYTPRANPSIYNHSSNVPFYYYYNSSDPYKNPSNVINVSKIGIQGLNCSCKQFGFQWLNYYLNMEDLNNDITVCEDLFTEYKTNYEMRLNDYTENYPESIDWSAYYNGDSSYQFQVNAYFELTNLQSSIDLCCLNAIKILFSAVELDMNSYMIWLNRMACGSMDLQIANCFLSLSDTSSMNNLLNSIPLNYSNMDYDDVNNYKTCLNYLATWNLAEADSLFIPQSDLDILDSIANLNNGFGSSLANSILNILNVRVDTLDLLNTCISPSTTSNLATTISELNLNKLINVCPNPTSTSAQISSSIPDNIIEKVSLYDIYGKLLTTENYHSNIINIDLSRYYNGVYILKCYLSNNQTVIKKIIKK